MKCLFLLMLSEGIAFSKKLQNYLPTLELLKFISPISFNGIFGNFRLNFPDNFGKIVTFSHKNCLKVFWNS